MTEDDVITYVLTRYAESIEIASWGERSVFHNPGRRLPRGVYFVTVKDHDGENDKASELDRDGVFRVNIGCGAAVYEEHFGQRPARPAKGGVVATGHDFAARDVLIPHPVYAWMGWVSVLNPSESTFESIVPLIEEARRLAVLKFEKRVPVA